MCGLSPKAQKKYCRATYVHGWQEIGRYFPLAGYHVFIHHFKFSTAFLPSCSKDGTYSKWNPLFFSTFGYIARCILKDLWSSFWWDEVEHSQACVYLKTPTRHLQCLLSRSVRSSHSPAFSTFVFLFPKGPCKKTTPGMLAIPNEITNKR